MTLPKSSLVGVLLAAVTTTTTTVAATCPNMTVVWAPSWEQVNKTSNPGSQYGMEDGQVIRREDGGLTMISAEMYTKPYAVAMQFGIFKSSNGLDWTRERTIRRSAGTTDGMDIHAAHWGPLLTKDPKTNTWVMSYVAYKALPSNGSGFLGNYQGTIFARNATAAGDAGLDGDWFESASGSKPAYDSDVEVVAPDDFNINGPWPYRCQGLQGTDSFEPYQLADGSWAALLGTSHEETPNPWANKEGKWVVSIATAPELVGPWTRYNPDNRSEPANAPCSDIAHGIENPVVTTRPDNAKAFHAVFDGGAHPGFGYACSEDGISWGVGVGVPYTAAQSVRTPFGLVPMTAAEIKDREKDILDYGVLTPAQLHAPNTSLQWVFLTAHNNADNWEHFSASIVQLKW